MNHFNLRLSHQLLLILVFSLSSTSIKSQVYVNHSAAGNNDGTTWTDAYTDLKNAITNTASGEIWVAQGTYTPDATDNTISFSMKNGIAIYGGFSGLGTETILSDRDFATYLTILSGDLLGDDETGGSNAENSYNVIQNSGIDGTAILNGFTVSRGASNGGLTTLGGGMRNLDSSPTVTNCIFSNNSATVGGGMDNLNSSPTLTNCTFFSNSAMDGGGGMKNTLGIPTLINCTFFNNSAMDGGGIYNESSSPDIDNCTFINNEADVSGGGVYNFFGSSPTLDNCTFTSNSTISNEGGACSMITIVIQS